MSVVCFIECMLFLQICVQYCVDVVAVVALVEINSIQFNSIMQHLANFPAIEEHAALSFALTVYVYGFSNVFLCCTFSYNVSSNLATHKI